MAEEPDEVVPGYPFRELEYGVVIRAENASRRPILANSIQIRR